MSSISNKILSLIAFAVAASMAAAFAAPHDSEADRARKKADYIFLEGQNAYNTDRIDDYIFLTRRAFELDSANIDIAAEWSTVELARNGGDSATVARAYSRLWRQFEMQPDNYITGVTMANIAARLGRTADVVRVWETLRDRYPAKAEPAEELANAYLRAYLRGDTSAYTRPSACSPLSKTPAEKASNSHPKKSAHSSSAPTPPQSLARSIPSWPVSEATPMPCSS